MVPASFNYRQVCYSGLLGIWWRRRIHTFLLELWRAWDSADHPQQGRGIYPPLDPAQRVVVLLPCVLVKLGGCVGGVHQWNAH